MKKLKIILPLIFIIFTLAVPTISASFNGNMVYDLDNSLTESEEEIVNKAIKEATDKYKMNIGIVITDDLKGKSPMNYADDFYDELFGINTDGILLLINNDTKINLISTSGSAIKKYRDSDIQHMLDDITPKLQKNDYEGASLAFIESLKYSYSKSYNWLSALGISFLISAAVSTVIGLIIVSQYKMHKTISATNYICENKTKMLERRDDFIREYVTKVKIDTDNNVGGFGGGHSLGRTSTHRSSRGGTHGGGGRRR